MQLSQAADHRKIDTGDHASVGIHRGQRKAEGHRVAPRAADRPVDKQQRHIGQHQRDQDFVGVEAGFQDGRDHGPGQTAEHASDDHRWQQERCRHAAPIECDIAREHRAKDHLPLGPDVPDIRPIGKDKAARDDDQRARLYEQIGHLITA